MKKLLITLLKVGLSAAIIGYLVWNSTQGEKNVNVFANLRDQPKDWWLLVAAWACCTASALLTFVRWWYLVRALDIPCRFADSIRISFCGYLLNLAPLGIVGGDLVKTVMLGHEHPQYRAKALASVLVDRIVGLYILFVVASVAILLTGFWHIDDPIIWWICKVTFILTGVGAVGLGVVLGPDPTEGRVIRAIGRIPRAGRPLENLINAVRMYSSKPLVLIASALMTIGVHSLSACGCYLIARGLPGNYLSLGQHLVVIPLSGATGALPLPLGPFEYVLDFLYAHVPVEGPAIVEGQGLVVVLTYRLITLLIAALSMFYYLGNRREMAEVIHEAEAEHLGVSHRLLSSPARQQCLPQFGAARSRNPASRLSHPAARFSGCTPPRWEE